MEQVGKRSKKGFTVAELLIVVGIIAVLVGIAIPVYRHKAEKAKEAYDIYTMRQAASAAIDLYYAGITDTNYSKHGLSWSGGGGNEGKNAYGAYDPGSGKFYQDRPTLLKHIGVPYGKGTGIKGGKDYYQGSDSVSAYLTNLDYRDAVILVSIFPYAKTPHAVIYWKYTVGPKEGTYVGGGSNNHPNHYIYIPFK